jgi:hypothetical protein
VVTAAQTDHMLRAEIVARLAEQQWTDFGERNVIVVNGVASLWGLGGLPSERKALAQARHDRRSHLITFIDAFGRRDVGEDHGAFG